MSDNRSQKGLPTIALLLRSHGEQSRRPATIPMVSLAIKMVNESPTLAINGIQATILTV